MRRFRAPAGVQLRRAQLTLMLATLVPTILMTAVGIAMLAVGSVTETIVGGVLVVAFCTSSLTGYILGSIFVSRGASVSRFQTDFLSSVSHELRTPLTSIRMFIEALSDDRLTDPAERAQCLSLLDREVQRLQGHVERLLELSRIEAGRHDFEDEVVSVADIVEEAMVAFDAATLAERVQVEQSVEPDLAVKGDASSLAQAISNLLLNAWKYTPPGNKKIALSARASDKNVHISVRDNGPGVPRQEQRQIFERFERGKTAIDGPQRGSGLGLAIVKAIVRAHKGKVEVHSSSDAGAEFRITLRRVA